MATNKTAADDDFELQRMVEFHLQDYYKALAELKMERPTLSKTVNDEFINHEELLNLYERVNLSLRENNTEDTLKSYVERFRHFIHLFFADEKLEFESKYKDDIKLTFLYYREMKKGAKCNKFAQRFAVYVFSLPSQSMEDMVMYQAISIVGHKGKITQIYRESNEIEVSFEDKRGEIKFDEQQSYLMDMEFNERQYISWMRSMFLTERGRVNFALFPDASKLMPFDEYNARLSEFEKEAKHDPHISKFDQGQRQAIFSVVNGVHGTVPYVIWGPPGTGKTVTIVECVRQLLLKDANNRILICTPSNTAADLIARRILEEHILDPKQMRRYYSLGKNVNDRDRALDKIIKIENCAIYGLFDDRFKLDPFEEMKNLRLIFSTLACSSYFEEELKGKGDNFFSHIFIDEAGQSLEPETLIPISRYATEKTRIVLCGDHEQLGAVVKAHFLKQFKSCHSSLMERLMKNDVVYFDGRTFCQLTDSYRCHPMIIQFSSVHFYKGKLRAVNVENRSSFCDWKHLPRKGFPLILHAIRKGAEVKQLEGRSFHNQHEIDVVLKYIQLLKETMDVPDEEIGVISPYKNQTHKIRECLRGRKITVDSVECYQGSERRVIILTLSRSEQIGFLSEYKRLNTSLTRAKELLIVVVSLDFVRNLQPNRHYRANKNYWIPFIEYCADNGAVLLDEFAGEDGKEMDSQQMKRNVKELRKCLSEDTNAQPTHEERRKKKPMPLKDLNPVIIQKKKISPKEKYISPFVLATTGMEKLRLADFEGQDEDEEQNKWQNWWNSESEEESSLEEEEEDEDEEDEGTVSSLSTDEEGQRFWARQIPWEGRAKKRKQKEMVQQELDWNVTDGGARWGEETDSTGGRGSTPGAEAEQAMVNCLMVCDAVEGLSIAGTPSSIDDDNELANAMQRLGTTDKTTKEKLPWHIDRTFSKASTSSLGYGTNYEQKAGTSRASTPPKARSSDKLPWHSLSQTSSIASKTIMIQSYGINHQQKAGTSSASAPSKASSSAVLSPLELSKKRNLNPGSAVPRPNIALKNQKSPRIPEEAVLDNEGVGPSQGPKRPRKSVLTAAAEIADPCVEEGVTVYDDGYYTNISRQTDSFSNMFTGPFRHGKNSNCRII